MKMHKIIVPVAMASILVGCESPGSNQTPNRVAELLEQLETSGDTKCNFGAPGKFGTAYLDGDRLVINTQPTQITPQKSVAVDDAQPVFTYSADLSGKLIEVLTARASSESQPALQDRFDQLVDYAADGCSENGPVIMAKSATSN